MHPLYLKVRLHYHLTFIFTVKRKSEVPNSIPVVRCTMSLIIIVVVVVVIAIAALLIVNRQRRGEKSLQFAGSTLPFGAFR